MADAQRPAPEEAPRHARQRTAEEARSSAVHDELCPAAAPGPEWLDGMAGDEDERRRLLRELVMRALL